jgi:hypothetical protein
VVVVGYFKKFVVSTLVSLIRGWCSSGQQGVTQWTSFAAGMAKVSSAPMRVQTDSLCTSLPTLGPCTRQCCRWWMYQLVPACTCPSDIMGIQQHLQCNTWQRAMHSPLHSMHLSSA